jgi:hypothetical protein
MTRYYFHLRSGEETAKDCEGAEFPDLDAACKEARTSAREMVADAVRQGKERTADAFVIADESGQELATVPMREALPQGFCDD